MSRIPAVTKDWNDVCVTGDEKVGKTAMIHLFNRGHYNVTTKYEPTIEDSYIIHVASSLPVDKVKLKLIDTSGRYVALNSLPKCYIDLSCGFIVMYSIDNVHSFDVARRLIKRIKGVKKDKDYSLVVLGNKADLAQQRRVTQGQLQSLCQEENVIGEEVSIMDKNTFYRPITKLVEDICKRTQLENDRDMTKKRGVVHKFTDLF